MEPVNTLGGKRDSGIEAKCQHGGLKIVVDRFRHTDDTQALPVQFVCNAEATIASDSNQRVKTVLPKTLDEFVGTVYFFDSAIGLFRWATKGITTVGRA
jgi:hypothetical protein